MPETEKHKEKNFEIQVKRTQDTLKYKVDDKIEIYSLQRKGIQGHKSKSVGEFIEVLYRAKHKMKEYICVCVIYIQNHRYQVEKAEG